MATKQFQNAKLKVDHLDLSSDTARSALQSGENISHSLGKIARWYKDIVWSDTKATIDAYGIVKLSDDYKSTSTDTVPTSKTLNDVVQLIKQTGGWNTTYDFNSNIDSDENLQNGQFKVTEHDIEGDIDHYVTIKGLGSAAFTDFDKYATAGHTHLYAGSSTAGGVANSAAKLSDIPAGGIGSETKPVYFSGTTGRPVACTYSLNASVPSGAIFTDEKVKQSPVTTDGSFEVLFAGSTGNTEKTEGVGKTTTLVFNPSSGALTATSFSGSGSGLTSLNASNISSGTLAVGRLADSGVVAGTYGPAANASLAHAGTFNVPDFTVDAKGRVTGAHTRTFTLPAQYVHPTHTSKTSGLYKITVDSLGHISATASVTASDLPSHTHTKSQITDFPASLKNPNSLTVQGNGTTSFTYDGSAAKTLNIKPGTGISVSSDTSGNITITNSSTNTDTKVTQTATTTNAKYELLFSGTADNTTRTEGARKNSNLIFNPATGILRVTSTSFGTIEVYRNEGSYGAAIKFYNNAESSAITELGSIGMNAKDGSLLRWNSGAASYYTICDTVNTTFTRSLSSGTKIGTIKIGGTSTDIYCQTNTNTTYSFATGDNNGSFKVTPSGGTATNIQIKGISHVAGNSTGAGIVIGYDGLTVVGSGESANALVTDAKLTGDSEVLYLTSDEGIAFYVNCQAIGNRKGMSLNAALSLYPNTTETGSVGTSSNKWNTMYAKTFHGALSGNASTATALTTNAGNTTTPVYFADGIPKALSYTIQTSVPSGAVFTDAKVAQTATTTQANYEVLFSGTADNTTRTEGARKAAGLLFNPSTVRLQLKGATSATATYGSTNPAIKFINSDGSQIIELVFTDYDRWLSTASLNLVGNQGKEWFTAPNISSFDSTNKAHLIQLKSTTIGTTDTVGRGQLIVGNSIASGTAGNARGEIALYDLTQYYVSLVTTDNLTTNRTIRFPNASGTISLDGHTHSYLPSAGGTMTGDITFIPVTSTTYTARSNTISFSGSTDWAKVLYEVRGADAGQLVLETGDDANARIVFRNKITSGDTATKEVIIENGVITGNGSGLSSLNASNISSGTLSADRLATSGATAGSYGPSANVTPGYGSTFNVPYITVDTKGRVTAISTKTVKIPASDNTNTTYSFATGDNNGTFKVTPSGGTATNIAIKGLGSAAYTASSAYATSGHTHGLGHSDFTVSINATTNTWAAIGVDGRKFVLKSIRTDVNAPPYLLSGYSAGIVFGGADTRGVISVAYSNPTIRFAGGANTTKDGGTATWYITLTGTHNTTYNLNTINQVTQTATTTSAAYEVLFSGTADNTTRTEGARKNSNLTFNPSTGTLTATKFSGSLSGNASTATTWATARTLTIGSTGKSVNGSANVSWSLSEIGAAASDHGHLWINNECSANRFAFLKPAGVTIEHSKNSGSSWTTANLTNDQKINLFTGSSSINIGGYTSSEYATSAYQTRITVDASAAGIYTFMRAFDINISTSGSSGSNVTIQTCAVGSTTYNTIINGHSIAGWSGRNFIYFGGFTFGTGSGRIRYIRFIFKITGGATSGSHRGLQILSIRGYGGEGWNEPSYMASTGHLYSYDAGQNAIFPAKVTATEFDGKIVGKSYNELDPLSSNSNIHCRLFYQDALASSSGKVGADIYCTYDTIQGVLRAPTVRAGVMKMTSGSYVLTISSNTLSADRAIKFPNESGTISLEGHSHFQYYDSGISRTKNTVLAAPNGSNGGATFRALVIADLPASGATAGSYGPSANASPAHSGTFSVPYITVNAKGQVTAISTKTITLPASGNTDAKVKQSETTTNSYRPIVFGRTETSTVSSLAATVTDQVYVSTKFYACPSTGTIYAPTFSGALSGNASTATKSKVVYDVDSSSWGDTIGIGYDGAGLTTSEATHVACFTSKAMTQAGAGTHHIKDMSFGNLKTKLGLDYSTLFSGTAAASVGTGTITGYTRLVIFCKNTSNSTYFTVQLQCVKGYHYHIMSTTPPPAAQSNNKFFGLMFNVETSNISVSAGKYSTLSSSAALETGPTVHITKVIGYKF